jgi:Undecaprenyl-phosphate glucose phosphotransferase
VGNDLAASLEIVTNSDAASSPSFADVQGPRRNLDFVSMANDALVVWDFLAVLLTGFLGAAVYRRFLLLPDDASVLEFWQPLYLLVGAAAVIAPALLRDRSLTSVSRFRHPHQLLSRLFRRGICLALLILALGFATHSLGPVSRLWAVAWAGCAFLFCAAGRVFLAVYLRRLDVGGLLGDRVAIVGAGPVADQLIDHFRTADNPVYVVGVFDDGSETPPAHRVPPRGSISNLVEIAQRGRLDWIILTLPATAENRIGKILLQLKTVSAQIALCPELVKLSLPHRPVDELNVPMMLLSERPLRRWQSFVKELEDKILASILILLLAPLLSLIALAIRLESPGPVIFSQKRHGWNNTEFTIFKFRTMRWQPNESGVLRQTTRGDDRLTRVGAFLRRSSLDELPQLFNVLRGDMSVVGPRPHAVTMRTEERLGHEIIAEYAHRHRVKPGITGWAQVNGYRGATHRVEELRKRVEYDLFYIENWSLRFDLKILALTGLRCFIDPNAF